MSDVGGLNPGSVQISTITRRDCLFPWLSPQALYLPAALSLVQSSPFQSPEKLFNREMFVDTAFKLCTSSLTRRGPSCMKWTEGSESFCIRAVNQNNTQLVIVSKWSDQVWHCSFYRAARLTTPSKIKPLDKKQGYTHLTKQYKDNDNQDILFEMKLHINFKIACCRKESVGLLPHQPNSW